MARGRRAYPEAMLRWIALGVVGVVACGPSPPPENDTDGGSSSSGNGPMTGLPMNTDGPTLPSTDPTITTAVPPTTGAVTTELPTSTTGFETITETSPTTTPTSATSTTGAECTASEQCAIDEACAAGECVLVEVIPPCPVVSVVDSHFPLIHEPTSLALGDFDGDLDLDIATGAPFISLIELQTNVGDLDFVHSEMIELVAATGFLHLATGDLDGDGDVDIAAAQEVASDVNVVLKHDGAWVLQAVLDSASGMRRVHLGNADDDGLVDLITLGQSNPSVGVWRGVGAGAFKPEPPFDAPLSFGVSVVEVSGDGRHDLVGPDGTNSFTSVRVLIRSDGGFVDGPSLAATSEQLVQVLAGDLVLDFDGAADLLALTKDGGGGLVATWPANEHAVWSPVPRLTRTTSVPTGGLLADFDKDGKLDLISALEAPAISVLHGDGSGGFVCERVFELDAPTTRELLAVGDVDLDGIQEIVTASVVALELIVIKTL